MTFRSNWLYPIEARYRTAITFLSDPDMPPQAVYDTLEGIEGELHEKRVAMLLLHKELKAEAVALQEQERSFRARREHVERQTAYLRQWVKQSLEMHRETSLKDMQVEAKIAKTPHKVLIDALDELPQGYYRVEKIPDKDSIKRSIKDGEDIPGARLVQDTTLRIK